MKYLFSLLFAFYLLFFSSCDDSSPEAPSRTIKYEVTGNFSGAVFASYTTASGGTNNESASLPWSKETAGQQVTIVVKKGNTQVSSTPITAGSQGSFSQSAPVVTF
jgi:hypothetical protein